MREDIINDGEEEEESSQSLEVSQLDKINE